MVDTCMSAYIVTHTSLRKRDRRGERGKKIEQVYWYLLQL